MDEEYVKKLNSFLYPFKHPSELSDIEKVNDENIKELHNLYIKDLRALLIVIALAMGEFVSPGDTSQMISLNLELSSRLPSRETIIRKIPGLD